MHELFYCSQARTDISKDDILNILEVSQRDNKKLDITGILLYWKKTNQFMQILEGDEKIIFDLYNNKIRKDSRHSSVKLVHHGKIPERGFNNWSMAFKDLDGVDTSNLEGFSEFSTSDFTDERTKIEPSRAISLIQSFKSLLP